MRCTIFRNIYDKKPNYIEVDLALQRIKNGRSKVKIEEIRSNLDKERQDILKRDLPSVCFSGEFSERFDEKIITHSGVIVLDFDGIEDVVSKKNELSKIDFVNACWISPRNNGIKALIKIADGKKHRQHFDALKEIFPDADKSGVNESRVCYESYDPEIYINPNSSIFKKVKVQEKVEIKVAVTDEQQIFEKIVRWLTNKGDAFVSGERNHFIFKLASACCRFGLSEQHAVVYSNSTFAVGQDKFSVLECERTVRSAYKSNKSNFGSAQFEKDMLVDTIGRFEIKIDADMLDESIRPKDVIFGEDVKAEALSILENGYEKVNGIGVWAIDTLFKFKEGEITLLSGYGNYGKSSFLGWKLLLRILIYKEKYAFFSPEENSVEFYHNLVEILLGCDCTPKNPDRPRKEIYERAFDFVSKHIFYVYPKVLSPTPEYIKERFLELIIKENVKGVVIDPFNQLDNNYRNANGRSDKYLEVFLSDCARFSQQNALYFVIIAHPKQMQKDNKGNYPCPDVFDIADGAMWNNKMDNILIYDRPNHQIDPSSDVCELYSKKIRRQKIVGRKGVATFNFNKATRRFVFGSVDPIEQAVIKGQYNFYAKNYGVQATIINELSSTMVDEDDIPF